MTLTNCECGNNCYTIFQGSAGRWEVAWEHDPADCPYNCEDCQNEGLTRTRVEDLNETFVDAQTDS